MSGSRPDRSGWPLVAALMTLVSCAIPQSRGTRSGAVVLPRSTHCSLEFHQHNEPVTDDHKVVGTVEVWGVGDDRKALEDELQLRACELGADAVVNLQRRAGGDATWVGQAVVWQSHAGAPTKPPPPPRPPQPTATPAEPTPPAEVAPVDTIEETQEEQEPRSKRKGKKGKRKKGKRRRRR